MGAITVEGKDILVTPPRYPSEEVKKELGGRWDKKAGAWRVAPTSMNVQKLVEWYGSDILEGAPAPVCDLYFEEWGFPGWYVRGTETPNGHHDELRERAEAHEKWGVLFPFQRLCVEYMCCNPHNGDLVGLSPGLGKTVVTAVAMDVLQCTRVLILAPLTLARNWIAELNTWSTQYRSMSRATAASKDPTTELVVTNFETMFEPTFRDEDGNVFQSEDMLTYEVEDEEHTGKATNPRHAKAWIEAGPKKYNQQGKLVPARERIVQARKSYAAIDWDLIVVDESILFKNRKAVKVDVVQQLAKYAHQVWLLSGSPTAKYRDDLYPQLKTIMPRGFSSYWRFAETFCIVEQGKWGWTIEGDRPGIDLHGMLKDFLFVRDQKDVLPELPDYIYRPLELSLTPEQRKAHNQMLDQWVVELEDEENVEAPNRLAQMTRLQQITSNLCNLKDSKDKRMASSSAKEDALAALIENDEVEFPLLVWVNYVPTGEHYAERLTKMGLDAKFVHGGASSQKQKDERDAVLQSFKDGELPVLIMQYEVGKFGHTFTQTRTVFYADRTWNSDSIVQSLRRVRRIGLTHSPVLIIPRCPGTIDDLIEMVLEGKLRSIAEVSQADLLELLRSLGRPV